MFLFQLSEKTSARISTRGVPPLQPLTWWYHMLTGSYKRTRQVVKHCLGFWVLYSPAKSRTRVEGSSGLLLRNSSSVNILGIYTYIWWLF